MRTRCEKEAVKCGFLDPKDLESDSATPSLAIKSTPGSRGEKDSSTRVPEGRVAEKLASTGGWPLLGKLQPRSESNRVLKFCAICTGRQAKSFCNKCKVTPYCSRACQTKHWASSHKKYCKANPLIAALEDPDIELPKYREYTGA